MTYSHRAQRITTMSTKSTDRAKELSVSSLSTLSRGVGAARRTKPSPHHHLWLCSPMRVLAPSSGAELSKTVQIGHTLIVSDHQAGASPSLK